MYARSICVSSELQILFVACFSWHCSLRVRSEASSFHAALPLQRTLNDQTARFCNYLQLLCPVFEHRSPGINSSSKNNAVSWFCCWCLPWGKWAQELRPACTLFLEITLAFMPPFCIIAHLEYYFKKKKLLQGYKLVPHPAASGSAGFPGFCITFVGQEGEVGKTVSLQSIINLSAVTPVPRYYIHIKRVHAIKNCGLTPTNEY